MLTTNDKEDIHISYLSAVCASASVSFDLQRHDDDSTDGIMKKLITLDDGTKYMSETGGKCYSDGDVGASEAKC